ncbi:unnamed protein product [Pelagomonas calceolata]|uniref:RING-type domain-containing protein n=2 Tax=Pelagomonas calceolata TaxID=35677 RepID=A0A8J2SG44_9STRA|nr:unnamed protein product [Pelagomonas calceolata]
MPTENEVGNRILQHLQAALRSPDAAAANIAAAVREIDDEGLLMASLSLRQVMGPEHQGMVLRIPGLRRITKRHLWKAVAEGNVSQAQLHQQIPWVEPPAGIYVNSRTGWTIVHEAVERGHSGAMLTLVAQLMGSDSVNKKTRTGLTPAHVAASKRDTLALMALANLGADLSVLAADRLELRELQKQASEAPEPPEPLEQARLMLATLDPSALDQPKLDTMQIDLATTKTTLETASERVQREVMRRELAVPRAEERPCAICLDRPPNVTFVPCGHKMTCEQCAAEVRECPGCRAPIQHRQRTYD